MYTVVSLPGVDDAVVVAVEEGDVLLHHAQMVVLVTVRGAVGVVDVRRRQSSRQICSVHHGYTLIQQANRAPGIVER